jgi:hypothetical protein
MREVLALSGASATRMAETEPQRRMARQHRFPVRGIGEVAFLAPGLEAFRRAMREDRDIALHTEGIEGFDRRRMLRVAIGAIAHRRIELEPKEALGQRLFGPCAPIGTARIEGPESEKSALRVAMQLLHALHLLRMYRIVRRLARRVRHLHVHHEMDEADRRQALAVAFAQARENAALRSQQGEEELDVVGVAAPGFGVHPFLQAAQGTLHHALRPTDRIASSLGHRFREAIRTDVVGTLIVRIQTLVHWHERIQLADDAHQFR